MYTGQEENLLDLVAPATTADTNIHTFSEFKEWINNSFQVKTQLNSASYIKKKEMVKSLKLRQAHSIGSQSPKIISSLKQRLSLSFQTLGQIQESKQALQNSWMQYSAKRSRKVSHEGGQLGLELRQNSLIKSHSAQSSRSFNGFQQINQYQLRQLLGKGSFADVYLGVDTQSQGNQMYAIKVLESKHIKKKLLLKKSTQMIDSPPPSQQSNQEKSPQKQSLASIFVRNEVAILKKMQHQYITKLYQVIVDNEKSKVYLVLQHCGGGFINESKENKGQYRKLLESECKRYCKQLAVALDYIHNVAKIAHRDIKPENILLNIHDEVKVSDFGLGTHKLKGKKVSGTPLYMPPQSQNTEENTSNQPGDIWALGVTLVVMLTGKHPDFYDHKINVQKTLNGLKDVSENCKNFISRCLQVDPSKRIKAQELLSHSWLGAVEQAQQLRATKFSYEINVTPADEENVFKAKQKKLKIAEPTSFKITFD